jgi:imidazolonepropionase-like amidohydrolase
MDKINASPWERLYLHTQLTQPILGLTRRPEGSVEEGKLVDLIVLSDDPFSFSTENLQDIKVDLTIVNGQVRYCRKRYVIKNLLKNLANNLRSGIC